MSDASGFMVAAYVLTVLTILGYGARLWLRSLDVRRRLNEARRDAPTEPGEGRPAPGHGFDADAVLGGHHVQA